MIPFNHLGWFFNLFSASAYPAAVVATLCDTLQTLPGGARLLDLGAGTGVMGNYAHACRSDLRFVAADPAEGMLCYVPSHVESVIAKAEELPFENNAFHAVVMGEALHHFDDPHRALGEIVRVLGNGGVLFVYEFDPSTLTGGFICRAERVLGEPGHFYTPERLQELLEAHGFAVTVNRYRWRYTIVARLEC